MKQNKVLKLLSIILPIVVAAGMGFIFIQNFSYNDTVRVCNFDDGELKNGVIEFEEASVQIALRSSEGASWPKNPVYDDDGNLVSWTHIGMIYDTVVINKSPNVMSDWELKIYMPEDLMLNQSWNGELEIHQYTATNENVQWIDLMNYSKYDVKLVHNIEPEGIFVDMKEGDYFVYHPNEDKNEMPIVAAKPDAEKPASVMIGFITYCANREPGYVLSFPRGELRYHLQASVVRNPFFWILLVTFLAWLVCLLAMIITRINIRRLVEQKKRDEQIIEQTMRTFGNFIEQKDPNTKGHSLRVAQYSSMLAECMGFSEDECKNIYYIALMHDCGKLYIPDEILTKPARLTEEEYEIMKKHTEYGSEILRDFTSIDNIQLGAMYHHERYDGKGYPKGLKGEDIPLIGRIICVSDAFDAMNSQRCYRKNLTPDVILRELKENSGTQFDPMVINHLLKLISDGKVKFS